VVLYAIIIKQEKFLIMKLSKIITLNVLFTVAFSLYLISCEKKVPEIASIDTDFSNSATVQVIDATVKSARTFIYIDNVPVSGAAIAFGGVYPGTAYALKVAAGSRSFLIKDTATVTTQLPLNFTQTFDAGKSYTIFMYDTLTSPKQLTVVNNIVIPADTTSRLRFANFIYNTTAVPAVDVYSYRRGPAPVFTNIATGTVTDFIPYASGLTDTLYVYATGTTSPLLVKSLVNSLTPSRSYTSVYNGSYKSTTKTVTTFATY
jgi:hypothetical protein